MSNQPGSVKFAAWMATPVGRLVRVAAGAALIVLGVAMGGVGGTIVALVGIVPAAMGATNRCLIGKIIGAPFKGQDSVDLVGS